MEAFARQSDFDKLSIKFEKFVEDFNQLFITNNVQQIAHTSVVEKLNRIELLLEKTQNNLEERISILEKEKIERLNEKDIKEKNLKRISIALTIVCAMFSSIHLKSFLHWVFSNVG